METFVGLLVLALTGLVIGAVAKFIMPGDDPGGIIVTSLIGLAGAVVGGFLSEVFGFGGFTGLNVGSFIAALVGALILLTAYRFIKKAT
jgi:uncharacterized membrane protein YeaQ/YmgE (transglycosylase-associated protein family)